MSIKIGQTVQIKHHTHHDVYPVCQARVTEWYESWTSGLVQVLDGPAKGMELTITQWPYGFRVIDGRGDAHLVDF